jgi:hypothetical protein
MSHVVALGFASARADVGDGSRTGQLKWACKREGASALKGKFVPTAVMRACGPSGGSPQDAKTLGRPPTKSALRHRVNDAIGFGRTGERSEKSGVEVQPAKQLLASLPGFKS